MTGQKIRYKKVLPKHCTGSRCQKAKAKAVSFRKSYRNNFLAASVGSRVRLNHHKLKALANEDTLLRHKCFPVCPRAQHLLRIQILCPEHKKCFWFCAETFCVRNKCFPVCAAEETSWATMCPQQYVLVCQGLWFALLCKSKHVRLQLSPLKKNW